MIEALATDQFTLRYFTYFFGVLTLPIFLFCTLPYQLRPGKQDDLFSGTSEHGADGGLFVNLISLFLKREFRQIQQGQQLRWGTSCLIVLQKNI